MVKVYFRSHKRPTDIDVLNQEVNEAVDFLDKNIVQAAVRSVSRIPVQSGP